MDDPTVTQVAFYLVFHLTKAFTAFIQRDSFLYWPYLLSTLALAAGVAIFAARAAAAPEHRSWWANFREYFSARVWWHPSSRADYRLYVANALLLPALFGVLLFGDLYVANL